MKPSLRMATRGLSINQFLQLSLCNLQSSYLLVPPHIMTFSDVRHRSENIQLCWPKLYIRKQLLKHWLLLKWVCSGIPFLNLPHSGRKYAIMCIWCIIAVSENCCTIICQSSKHFNNCLWDFWLNHFTQPVWFTKIIFQCTDW